MLRPFSKIISVAGGLAVFAVTAVVAFAGEQPPPPQPVVQSQSAGPAANPDLVTRCGLDVVLVLDESGSIRGSAGGPDSTEEVRLAAELFLSGLSETGSSVAVVDFADRANIAIPYLGVTEQTLTSTFRPYLKDNYKPDGWTNWDDAFSTTKRVSDANPKADLVLFVTDGDPTAYNNAHPNDQPGGAVTTGLSVSDATALANAVYHANALKVAGSHILMVGVGAALTGEESRDRLRAVSGPDQFPAAAFGSADYMLVTNFSDLAKALEDIAAELCRSSVSVTKRVDSDSDGVFDNDAFGWKFRGNLVLSAGSYAWINPPGDAASARSRRRPPAWRTSSGRVAPTRLPISRWTSSPGPARPATASSTWPARKETSRLSRRRRFPRHPRDRIPGVGHIIVRNEVSADRGLPRHRLGRRSLRFRPRDRQSR